MKYLILGAGPAGLSLANKFKQNGITDFLVLEKEKTAGGLCRSEEVGGAPFDIGGGLPDYPLQINLNKMG